MPTTFAKKLAATAQKQYDLFHFDSENDPPLANQIEKYWTGLGLSFPGVDTAWSAVFISWCVKQAGATAAEFKFAAAHSVFVHKAIQNQIITGTSAWNRQTRIINNRARGSACVTFEST